MQASRLSRRCWTKKTPFTQTCTQTSCPICWKLPSPLWLHDSAPQHEHREEGWRTAALKCQQLKESVQHAGVCDGRCRLMAEGYP